MSGPISVTSTDVTPAVQADNSGGGVGVLVSSSGTGVWAVSNTGTAIIGTSNAPSGVAGEFQGDVNISGTLRGGGHCKIAGTLTGGGDVNITGNVNANDVWLTGQDCAEEFDIDGSGALEPGTVVVINSEGLVSQTIEPYNKRAAGVISGAGKYRPAIVLGRGTSSGDGKACVALMGRVYCKVDASYSRIEVGDMLTTSPTPGCAMRASDPVRAFGAVIGKALASVNGGRDLIPILVTLQ
jgi:hypothetical protein